MGAVNFSLDERLLDRILSQQVFEAFVETGTFKGDTIGLVKDRFPNVYSIELSEALYNDAVLRFRFDEHVHLFHGDSASHLESVAKRMTDKATIFWLDAHWCVAPNTTGQLSQCPLLDEINSIGNLNEQSMIIIDDARLFLSPPLAPHEISQWPSFQSILDALSQASKSHRIMVVNDVIIYYPFSLEAAITAYAHNCGVDWLHAYQSLTQADAYRKMAEEKEALIQAIKASNLEKELENKEAEIQRLARIVGRLQSPEIKFLRFLIRPFARWGLRVASIFRPRLGNLNQYRPREVTANRLDRPVLLPEQCPTVAIVTPSFNQGNYIEKTILSVLDQNYPALEYYVQDGGSKDETVDILKKYSKRITGWATESDEGQSQAINRGFKRTSGEIMAWLNSDDLLLPFSINAVVAYFNEHPEVDVVYGNRILIDGSGKEIGRWILPCHSDSTLEWADFIPQETMFWRRELWNKVGCGVDESFRFAMDWDLLIRFKAAGARFAHLPRFLGAFRVHDAQKTSAAIHEVGCQEMSKIRARLHGAENSPLVIKKKIATYIVRHVLSDLKYRINFWIKSRRRH